jgi:hypothetical protein
MWHVSIDSWRDARTFRFEAAGARALATTFRDPDVTRDLQNFAQALEDEAAHLDGTNWTKNQAVKKQAKLA